MKDILSSLKSKKFSGKKGVILGGISRLDQSDLTSSEFKNRPEVIEHLKRLNEIGSCVQKKNSKKLGIDKIVDLSKNGEFKCPFCETVGSCAEINEHINICVVEYIKNDPEWTIRAFATINDYTPLRNGIEILKKYIINIITNPNEKKFKCVKTSNKIFISEILPLKCHSEIFEYFGFRKQKIENQNTNSFDEVFVLENPNIPHLENCLKALDTKNRIYPILSRSVKKYFIKTDSKIPEDEKDLEITANDVSNEYRRVREEAIERSQLKSRSNKSEGFSNKVVTLKIRTPDSSILQGCFYTDEVVEDLYAFIISNLTDVSIEFALQFHYVGVLGPGQSRNKIILCDCKKLGDCGITTNMTLHMKTIGTTVGKDYLNDSSDQSYSTYNYSEELD